jgi:hypothetical protein
LLAGTGEEVPDIGVEPAVVAARAPESEAPVRRLIGQHLADRLAHPLADLGVGPEPDGGRDLVEIEHGQGTAGELLGAAVGVAIQTRDQAGDVQRPGARDGDGERSGAGEHLGPGRGVEAQLPARGQIHDRVARDQGGVGADRDPQGLGQCLTVGRAQDQTQGLVADRDGFDGDLHGGASALRQAQRPLGLVGGDADMSAVGRHRQGDLARRSVDMGQLEQQARAVLGREEARQARHHDDRIAHHHILDRMADALLGPGHRHDPQGAVEVRDVEGDRRPALGVETDDLGLEGDQILGGRRAFEPDHGAVAAGAHHAGHALHAVDELAVEVADLHPETALTEVPTVRRGRLIAGEVQDPEIDRRQGDIDRLAGRGVGDLDRDLEPLARADHARGRIKAELTSSRRSPGSTPAQVSPIARPGMRRASRSIGR